MISVENLSKTTEKRKKHQSYVFRQFCVKLSLQKLQMLVSFEPKYRFVDLFHLNLEKFISNKNWNITDQ